MSDINSHALGFVTSKVLPIGREPFDVINKPNNVITSVDVTNVTTLEHLRKEKLDFYRRQQPFRVSIGKSRWQPYETFNPAYNLREILNNEVVIEFDSNNEEIIIKAIMQSGINLYNAGYYFEWWCHGGRSPHLHIRNLPIGNLEPDKKALFKKLFIRKYVPLEYLPYVDFSLTGCHLIAIEWAKHWKGKYGIKKLISVFDGKNKKSWGVCDK